MKLQTNRSKLFVVVILLCLAGFAALQAATPSVAYVNTSTQPVSHPLAAGILSVGKPAVSFVQDMGLHSWPLQSQDGDKLVLGGNFTLQSGEILDGSLIVLGGNVQILEGATVNGDIVVLGGSLSMNGVTDGDVFILAGIGELGQTALVRGDVTTVSGNLRRETGAQIEGDISENVTAPIPLPLPGNIETPSVSPPVVVNNGLSIWDGLFFLFRSFMWAALAILVVLFLPKNTQRIADTVVSNTLVSCALGLLTAMVAPIILVVVAITIIGIPVSFLAALVLGAAWALGMVVVGVETGNRLGRFANQEWALPVSAGIGTFLMTIVVNGIGEVIPCIGWLAPLLVGSIGLGAVLLTVFGTRGYPPAYAGRVPLEARPITGAEQNLQPLIRQAPPPDVPEQATPPDEENFSG